MSYPQRRRVLDASGLAMRAAEGDAPRSLVGHAAVFDQWTVLHDGKYLEIREVVRPGAFRNAISGGQDVRALVDHNPTLILGRTRSGTLALVEDDRGLLCRITPPDTQTARDVFANVEAGNVSQMSFAFLPRPGGETITIRTEGDRTIQEIEISDVDLYDVSLVTYPAYEATDVAIRSRDLTAQIHREWLARRKADVARLEVRDAVARLTARING